jgi:hypothetical protein
VPDQLVCGPAAGGNQQAGCNPNGQSTSFNNRTYDNWMGIRPDGTPDPNGTDFWWDPYPGTTGNCWWDNHAAPGANITSDPAGLPECAGGTKPEQSIGTGNPKQTGELVSCVAAFESRNFDPNGACPWFKTPPEPQPGGSAKTRARSADAFTPLVSARRSVVAKHPIDRRSDFSSVSCAEWNAADATDRAWLLAKLKEFLGGAVVDGERVVGYGDTLTTQQATQLFDNWCPNSYADSFVLYKLYSYAAAIGKKPAG